MAIIWLFVLICGRHTDMPVNITCHSVPPLYNRICFTFYRNGRDFACFFAFAPDIAKNRRLYPAETRSIDGKKYLLIPVEDSVEINGQAVRVESGGDSA